MTPGLTASPFPEDQLALIRRLLAAATPEQRQWLGGYIAGFHAAREAPATAAPAAPAQPKTPLTILYGSESGNAESLAANARKAAARLGFAAKLVDMADTTPADIARAGNVLVIASTWGEGDPPQRAEAFHAALMAEDAPRLDGLRYAVLALGDRAYARFCETGRQFDERFSALGATRAAERVECDLDFRAPAAAWIDSALAALGPPPEEPRAAVIHVDFARNAPAEIEEHAAPVAAEITAHVNLNSSRSDVQTVHVELSLAGTGLTYQPGDAIGFVPENDPALVQEVLSAAGLAEDAALRDALAQRYDITTLTRGQLADYAELTGSATLRSLSKDATRTAAFLADRQFVDLLEAEPRALTAAELTGLLRPLPRRLYSVASSQAAVGEEAHLLIARVAWESHGRARNGVASAQVVERRKPGDTLPLQVKANPHFRLPAPDAPIIMIGPGTGVAPFRAFLQEREATAAPGRNWLFFGARRFTHDFLYQLEWQDWKKSGLLTRVDLAFSRDQREKIYVQHRMWEARHELYAWLREGAYLYVCGDAKAMAKDVHAMLLAIIAEQSGLDADAAAAELRSIQRAGRYLRDVY
ncbi:MAG: flavodoxin domain-containing protein [Acidisphaera sp.]|nr:flavodoxin domain-containing protein [Acidisphaera sp.]